MGEPVSLDQRLRWRERPARSPVMYQTWTDLLFAHWEVAPEVLQASLPPGLTVDTWNSRAYLGVIPFFMRRVRPRGTPALPWISYFHELNVRTYVFDASGTPGIWFYSLECNQPIAVWLARALLGLPYQHARMRAPRAADGTISYRSRRRRGDARAEFAYRLGESRGVAAPGTLEFFLVERYLLFTVHRDRLLRAQVHHRPYPLHSVAVNPMAVAGLGPPGVEFRNPPAHLIGSSGVAVEIFGAEPAAV
jgi:uncharacterized protein